MKQKSHKLLSLLLTCALMLSLAPTALAAHQHEWSEWTTTKAATCTQDGERARRCNASGCTIGTETETIKAPGHKWGATVPEKAATCTTTGTGTQTCSVCKETKSVVLGKLEHSYSVVSSATIDGFTYTTKAATCSQDGMQVKKCSSCGYVVTETIKATGAHTPISSTIKNNGATHSFTCSVCNQVQSNKAHTYSNGTCTICGAIDPNAKDTVRLSHTSYDFYSLSETLRLTATVTPSGHTVTSWTSSNTSVATVNSAGVVTPIKQGTATITARTANGGTASCTVRVLPSTSTVLTASPSSVSVNTGDSAYVSVSTNRSDGYYVQWSVPANSCARVSTNRSNWDYSTTTSISTSHGTGIYVYGSATGSTTLTATLLDNNRRSLGSISIPVYVGRASSILSAYPSSITTNYNGWSGSVYVTTNASGYDGSVVDWSTSNNNVRVSTSNSTSGLGTSARTYINNRTSGSVYVYASGSGYLTATLRRTTSSTAVDSITIPVNTNSRGYSLSPSPSNASAVYLNYYNDHYDDYYWDNYRYSRDFSVTPMYNGSSILNSGYSISYTWTLNNVTQVTNSSSRSFTLYASNSALNRNSRSNTLTCTARISTGGSYVETTSVSWTVYTDYYYDDGYTLSATVYDTSSGYDFDERDDKGGSSIISQMQAKMGSREDIDYVRFSNVSDTYGDLNASTSRSYYYSGTRGSYDLRDVTFTPTRAGRTGTASFGCTVYGTRGSVYNCTIRITVTSGDSTRGDIKYTAKAGASTDFSASDFRSWWRDNYSRGDLDYVRFSSPSNGSLYIDYDRSSSKSVGSTNCYYSPTSSQTGINDLTFVPSSSSTKSASVRFTAYGTSNSGSNTSMSGTVTITYSGNSTAATITYSTTGTKSVNLSASDFTSRYRDVMGSSASTLYIRFQNVPSSGTLTYNNTTLTSSNVKNYDFSSSSSGSYRISDLKYTPRNNSTYTETVNYDCYTGSTLRFSGTVTFKNTADSQPANVVISYSTTGANVTFNAADFIVGKGSAMAGSNYVVFGSPSSGSLYVGSSPLAAGSKVSYVAASGMQLLGSVSYHPAAGYSGTASVPFTAYNANGTQAASGTVNIQVTQQTPTVPTTPTTFGDVPSTAWFYNDVTTLAKANIVNGRNDGLFHPNDPVNYGEALKLILLAAGYPQQTEGSGAAWAQNYLNLAIAQGILPGAAGNYSLSAAMNRTTIATVAAKALKLTPVTNEASPYADAVDAEGYVLALTKAGIVQGDASSGKQMWNGSDNLTRAQISRIVYNVYKYRNVAPGGSTSTDTSKPSWLS